MASVTFAIPDKVKSEMKALSWVNWSDIIREELITKNKLLDKLESKEEQELIEWSVELGRRAKRERFKRLLSEVSPDIREKLLKLVSKRGKSLK